MIRDRNSIDSGATWRKHQESYYCNGFYAVHKMSFDHRNIITRQIKVIWNFNDRDSLILPLIESNQLNDYNR